MVPVNETVEVPQAKPVEPLLFIKFPSTFIFPVPPDKIPSIPMVILPLTAIEFVLTANVTPVEAPLPITKFPVKVKLAVDEKTLIGLLLPAYIFKLP